MSPIKPPAHPVPLERRPPGVLEFVGAFESTYQPAHDVDVAETTGHAERWRADLALLAACGVTRLRYPVRWHRIEAEPGRYDWRATDEVLGHLGAEGFRPIVDLVHHTSYPRWLDGGFADPRFGPAYLRYCEAFARRYPDVEEYTLFNEPFATLFLCGHEGLGPPYARGVGPLVRIFSNVLPAVSEASRMWADLLPGARHVYVDTCEAHHAGGDAPASRAAAGAGVPLEGYCWFPFVDSCDWDSLLARADSHVDPVGVYWLDADRERRPSAMASSYALAARGAPAAELAAAPAARLGVGAPTIRPRPLRMGGPE